MLLPVEVDDVKSEEINPFHSRQMDAINVLKEEVYLPTDNRVPCQKDTVCTRF